MGNCASSAGSVAIAQVYRGTCKEVQLGGEIQSTSVDSTPVKPSDDLTQDDWNAIRKEIQDGLNAHQ